MSLLLCQNIAKPQLTIVGNKKHFKYLKILGNKKLGKK